MTVSDSQPLRHNLPFIIFSPPRTGSTTLAKLLNRHPALRCEFEPFNPGYTGPIPFLMRSMVQTQGIAAAVQALWMHGPFNGFKHVRRAKGWPFEGQPELNDWLLTQSTVSIILLSRRNHLQRAISDQISTQMGIWVYMNEKQHQRVRSHHYGPLDIAALQTEIAYEKAEFRRTSELAAATGKPCLTVYYEDYFAPGLDTEARIAAVQELTDFLGLPRVTDPERLEAMRWLLDPKNTGFENAQAYDRIPNIREVERELGCAENGFAFEG